MGFTVIYKNILNKKKFKTHREWAYDSRVSLRSQDDQSATFAELTKLSAEKCAVHLHS